MHCENENRDFNSITRTLHTNVIIGENKKDLDNKIKKISEDTTIPESYFHTRPLVGTKDEVFENYLNLLIQQHFLLFLFYLPYQLYQ